MSIGRSRNRGYVRYGTYARRQRGYRAAMQIAETLRLVSNRLPIQRRLMHAGDSVYRAGEPFAHLYVVNSGFFKVVNTSPDGRIQVVSLNFRGDWLGFDGIAEGHYVCDGVALDTGEVWTLGYDALLQACLLHPPLLAGLHAEMSRAITRAQDSMLSLCTLPVAARVAEFLRKLSESLADCGQRNDQITLRMSRSEIGSYLGMTLESVSRALSSLAHEKVILFTEIGRRDLVIPDLQVLTEYIRGNSNPVSAAVQ